MLLYVGAVGMTLNFSVREKHRAALTIADVRDAGPGANGPTGKTMRSGKQH
jgi:hypothetical protein